LASLAKFGIHTAGKIGWIWQVLQV
jgi:hypothetical protein